MLPLRSYSGDLHSSHWSNTKMRAAALLVEETVCRKCHFKAVNPHHRAPRLLCIQSAIYWWKVNTSQNKNVTALKQHKKQTHRSKTCREYKSVKMVKHINDDSRERRVRSSASNTTYRWCLRVYLFAKFSLLASRWEQSLFPTTDCK